MSYDIRMNDPKTGEPRQLENPHRFQGGTYAVGGTTEVWLSVTYNYVDFFVRVLGSEGIRTLYGLTGAQATPLLVKAISQLSEGVDSDYWKATEGNARAEPP